MADLRVAIPAVRDAVVAVLAIRPSQPGQFQCSWGTAFCVVADRYLITAFHVLNGGQPRDPAIKHYALVVPGNGNPFFYFPVIGFPVERPELDLAVLEIGPCSDASVHLPALPIAFGPMPDGTQVLTVGFPAPEIAGLNADADGTFRGGQFFLKSHANHGIVAAQYVLGANLSVYELNVGWHHGESGGPIATLSDRPAAFSVMQQYRNTQGPNGPLPGPRRGVALSTIRTELEALGVVAAIA